MAPTVDALIVEGRQAGRREVCGGLTLALHASRTASPANELQAIETILEMGGAESESLTVKEIAAQTGMSVQTVRRRLRLRSLTPALRAAFDEGKITASLAEAAARLPDSRQQKLEDRLEAGSRLSVADVRDVARGRTAAATGELPGGVSAESEVVWQVTVHGHLIAALRAIPPDGGYDEHDGVELSGLRTDPAANTACAFVAYARDGSREFGFYLRDSAAARLSVADLGELPERATWLHISGATLALSDTIAIVAEHAIERSAAAVARVSLDPNLRPEALTPDTAARIRMLAAHADVLLPSEGELETLGLPADAVPVVCTTLGARGVDVAVEGRHEFVPALPARERDPTGAGDTFAAAFVAATFGGA